MADPLLLPHLLLLLLLLLTLLLEFSLRLHCCCHCRRRARVASDLPSLLRPSVDAPQRTQQPHRGIVSSLCLPCATIRGRCAGGGCRGWCSSPSVATCGREEGREGGCVWWTRRRRRRKRRRCWEQGLRLLIHRRLAVVVVGMLCLCCRCGEAWMRQWFRRVEEGGREGGEAKHTKDVPRPDLLSSTMAAAAAAAATAAACACVYGA